MARAFRRDHAHVHEIGRLHLAEVDGEAVREHQGLPGTQRGGNLGAKEVGLDVVGHQDHDHVRGRHSLAHAQHAQALLLRRAA